MINIFSKLIIIFIIYNSSVTNLLLADIFIETKIDDVALTNFDIKKEEEYLKLLNKNLVNLEKNKLTKLSKESLIREIIKKKEIQKNFKTTNQNDFLNNKLVNLMNNLGYENEEMFKSSLALNPNNYSLNEIKEKINIELKWNELIYNLYKNQININEKKLIDKIDKNKNIKEYNLSELVFEKKKGTKLKQLINEIYLSISEIGFENSAIIYSLSPSSKVGGEIGWVNENSLSNKISESLEKIKIKEITEVIQIGNNFLILKLNGTRNLEKKVDKKKELQKLILIETNNQLNRFSKMYFDKIKLNYSINE